MSTETYSVFAGHTRIATGPLRDAAVAAKHHHDAHPDEQILIFSDESGRQRDFDLSGSEAEFTGRELARETTRGPGRPRLGVECGELCLLPRHWDWLAAQSRSASATVRRLIDAARKNESPEDRARIRVAAADKFLWAIAGDLPEYEEASRALYAHDWERFRELSSAWPEDIRVHAHRMLESGTDGG